MAVEAKNTGPRRVAGIHCEAFRITGVPQHRPFTVYVADNGPSLDTGTCYYLRHSAVGPSLLLNSFSERHLIAGAIAKVSDVTPASFVGV